VDGAHRRLVDELAAPKGNGLETLRLSSPQPIGDGTATARCPWSLLEDTRIPVGTAIQRQHVGRGGALLPFSVVSGVVKNPGRRQCAPQQ